MIVGTPLSVAACSIAITGINYRPHDRYAVDLCWHAKATVTHWYVTATPEFMAVAAERFACFVEGGRR